jgi:hypothetical protein
MRQFAPGKMKKMGKRGNIKNLSIFSSESLIVKEHRTSRGWKIDGKGINDDKRFDSMER